MGETELEESLMDCGLQGQHNDTVKVGDLNNHMRKAALHHLLPLKREMRNIRDIQRVKHAKDETWQAKVEAALFDPQEGLVHIRKWMTRIAFAMITVIVSLAGVVLWVATLGHNIGWW